MFPKCGLPRAQQPKTWSSRTANCRQFRFAGGRIDASGIRFGGRVRLRPFSDAFFTTAGRISFFMPAIPSPKPSSSRRVASRRKTLALLITEHVRQEIVTGLREPGSKISEPTIAAAHAVSRAPVRESLRQLEREGLVVFDAVGRSRVVQLTNEDVEDICGIRASLESTAAGHAARRFNEAIEQALRSNIAEMEAATTLDEVSQLDLTFHAAIMEASGRRRLITAWKAIEPQLRLWLGTLQRLREAISADVLAATLAAHRQLTDVLSTGDAAAARAAVDDHIASWACESGGSA